MYHSSEGIFTRQAHKAIPEGHFEEEQGRKGFFGPVSHLIRKKPSTRWKSIEGELKPRMYDLVELPHSANWQRMLYNNDCAMHMAWFKPAEVNPSQGFRNADADVIYFCHRGEGTVLTEYGALDYRESDYVVMPKCVTHSFMPAKDSSFFIVENFNSLYEEPDRGIVGRHGVYDIAQISRPNLEKQYDFLAQNKQAVTDIQVKHAGEFTRFEFAECYYDVVGWKGDFFPFTLNMDQIMPLMSHRAHLPPSAHTTFVARNFVVCSFCPRPLERDADALKVPFYHQNIDYDEVLFYHNGDFFSRSNLHPGMMSFHPAGFPHGPHPKAIKTIDQKTDAEEYAVMVDTRFPLKRDSFLEKVELENYWQSWQE